MKTFKRILTATLALIMAVGMLSGCKNDENAKGGLKTVHIWSGDRGAKAVMDVLTEEFNKTIGKEKGMQIEWTYYTENLNEVVSAARKNGTLPEFFELPYLQRESYIQSGDIVAIDDLKGGTEYINSKEWTNVENWNVFDGKTYAFLPYATCTGFIYNKDLFKAAGLVDENGEAMPPKTWDEVREYAKILTNEKDGTYGYCFPEKFGYTYTAAYPFNSSSDGEKEVYPDKGTYEFPMARPMLNFLCGVKADGSMMPGAESLDNDTARAYFAEGKIGMMPAMSWDVGVLTEQFPAKCDWGVADMPVVAGEEYKGVFIELAGTPVINAKARELGDDVVMEVVKFLTSVETRTKLYEEGIKISTLSDVLENVSPDAEIPEQFRRFAELATESKYVVKSQPSVKIEGLKASEIYAKVFAGEMSVDEGVADLEKRYTEALLKGVENGEYTLEQFK